MLYDFAISIENQFFRVFLGSHTEFEKNTFNNIMQEDESEFCWNFNIFKDLSLRDY